ncbi:hypothetical protein MPER_12739 [Moniliophthora perniciosa FA553]|nr:hypothetical protein MPER_12739 [Moniliophthora perniciosa FA553]
MESTLSTLLASADWDVLSSYAGLLGLACFSIYCGSYGSLSDKTKNKKKKDDDAEDEEEEPEDEVVTMEDAWLFPVVCGQVPCGESTDIVQNKIGSAVLFGLFLVIKYLGKEWITGCWVGISLWLESEVCAG